MGSGRRTYHWAIDACDIGCHVAWGGRVLVVAAGEALDAFTVPVGYI